MEINNICVFFAAALSKAEAGKSIGRFGRALGTMVGSAPGVGRVEEGMGETARRVTGPILPSGISSHRQERVLCFRVTRDEMQEEINAPMPQRAEHLTPLTFTVHLGYR